MINGQPTLEEPRFDPGSMATSSLSTQRSSWYRRPWVLLSAALIVIVAVSIVSDLPHPISAVEDAAAQNASLKQINHDLAPCAYAVDEAFRFYRQDVAGQLTPGKMKVVNLYLTNDQTVCSFASSGMSDLTNNLQVLDTSGGKYIDKLLLVIVTWMDSSANGAIFDIQHLIAHPHDPKLLADLTKRERFLEVDRQRAFADLATARSLVGAPLNNINVPAMGVLPGT